MGQAPEADGPPAGNNLPGLRPIGVIHSCFGEKFGIPRQSGLIPEAEATLELLPPFDREEALRGLEDFSHVWVLFLFHEVPARDWRPTVRPPRLGGNRRIGVFASRSPFRPNPIGLSAVRLLGIERTAGRLALRLGGVDLLDGTPVLDIKPYVPYADAIPGARGGFAEAVPGTDLAVTYAAQPAALLAGLDEAGARRLRTLIERVLAQDPRPAYLDGPQAPRRHGMRLLGHEVQWHYGPGGATVTAITPLPREP